MHPESLSHVSARAFSSQIQFHFFFITWYNIKQSRIGFRNAFVESEHDKEDGRGTLVTDSLN